MFQHENCNLHRTLCIFSCEYVINRNPCCYKRQYTYFHTKDHLRQRPYNMGDCLSLAWNSVGARNCYLDILDKLQKLLVLYLLVLLNPWLIVEIQPTQFFCIGFSELAKLVVMLYSLRPPFFVLIGHMIFLLRFLKVIRISISIDSFLAQLNCGILYLYNLF